MKVLAPKQIMSAQVDVTEKVLFSPPKLSRNRKSIFMKNHHI